MDLSYKRYQKNDFIRGYACILESVFMVDEGVQVHGMIAVLDFSDYNVKFQSAVSIEERKQFIQSWQVQPAR